MTYKEYLTISNYNYQNLLTYFKNKYGKVPFTYGNNNNSRSSEGLEIHHDAENIIAGLSNAVKTQPEYQVAEMLTYVTKIEHMLLHIAIAEETAQYGLAGAFTYIIPELRNFFNEGRRNPNINKAYYDVINTDEDKAIFIDLLDRYNKVANNFDIVLEQNKTLYMQVEKMLEEKNKALIVLGTGLGKTTTALQYVVKHNIKALVIGPNNLIKSGWERYPEWCDTTTYQSFANAYETLDYSKYGVIIIDEAHHAGYDEESGKGAAVWSKGIRYIVDKGIKLLGLTATPDRTDAISLGEGLFKDCVCEGLAIEDAIEKNIVHPFSYITAVYDTKEMIEELREKYDDETDSNMTQLFGQLDLAINNTPTLKEIILKYMPKNKRKGIIFIQEIADKEYATQIFKDVYPDAEFRAIDSKMKPEEVAANRKWFEETDEGYLLAVNMISEGAHYKGVNTLIMFRRTNSYLVYTQQIGRIITLMKDEDPNAIVFDLVNNIDNVQIPNKKLSAKKKEHTIKKILGSLREVAAKSDQIIIADETKDIVKSIKKIKEYSDSTWQEWEDEIIRQYYPTEGAKGCMERINARWDEIAKEGKN